MEMSPAHYNNKELDPVPGLRMFRQPVYQDLKMANTSTDQYTELYCIFFVSEVKQSKNKTAPPGSNPRVHLYKCLLV